MPLCYGQHKGYPGIVSEVLASKSHVRLIYKIKTYEQWNRTYALYVLREQQLIIMRMRNGIAYLKDQYLGFTTKQSFFDTFDGLRQNLKMIWDGIWLNICFSFGNFYFVFGQDENHDASCLIVSYGHIPDNTFILHHVS